MGIFDMYKWYTIFDATVLLGDLRCYLVIIIIINIIKTSKLKKIKPWFCRRLEFSTISVFFLFFLIATISVTYLGGQIYSLCNFFFSSKQTFCSPSHLPFSSWIHSHVSSLDFAVMTKLGSFQQNMFNYYYNRCVKLNLF